MRKTIYLLILVSLYISCKSTKKQSNTAKITQKQSKFIDATFKKYQGANPGASIIIIKDGEIALTRSYGYADMEQSRTANANTKYRIASVSKQFTALAIMILIEQGKLNYETTLTEIFPRYPNYGTDITVRHLLTHRSGLVRYHRFLKEDSDDQMLDRDVLAGLIASDSTYFTPGSKYNYSNTGYAVLAQIVEKVSGLSFADFMEKEIFKPLKMGDATVYLKEKSIKDRAYGYLVKDTLITFKDQSRTSAIQGDGGVYASVLDYYKWDQALYTDKLLPQEVLTEAFYNYDENGKSDTDGYGYGWSVNYSKGLKILKHGGSSAGFGSQVYRIPSKRLTVAVFTNRNKSGQDLSNAARALVSMFSNGLLTMPFEVPVRQEIDENGITKGLEYYNNIKKDTINYAVSKGSLFNFGISYINANQNEVALPLFEQLIEDYPDYFGGYYGAAIVHRKETRNNQAILYYKKTITHCTENQQWAINRSKKMLEELERK